MALAGHAVEVYITTSASTPSGSDELDGVSQVSLERIRDELETTDFKDTTGAKLFILGLQACNASVSGDYESADTAMTRLTTAWGDGSSVWIHVYWDGASGHKIECKVPQFNLSAGVGDKVTFDCTLRPTGAVAAAP